MFDSALRSDRRMARGFSEHTILQYVMENPFQTKLGEAPLRLGAKVHPDVSFCAIGEPVNEESLHSWSVPRSHQLCNAFSS
jgi:hypothetical protein